MSDGTDARQYRDMDRVTGTLDRIEALRKEGRIGAITITEVLALVEVAKAAQTYVEQEGWHPDNWHALRAALARLEDNQ